MGGIVLATRLADTLAMPCVGNSVKVGGGLFNVATVIKQMVNIAIGTVCCHELKVFLLRFTVFASAKEIIQLGFGRFEVEYGLKIIGFQDC